MSKPLAFVPLRPAPPPPQATEPKQSATEPEPEPPKTAKPEPPATEPESAAQEPPAPEPEPSEPEPSEPEPSPAEAIIQISGPSEPEPSPPEAPGPSQTPDSPQMCSLSETPGSSQAPDSPQTPDSPQMLDSHLTPNRYLKPGLDFARRHLSAQPGLIDQIRAATARRNSWRSQTGTPTIQVSEAEETSDPAAAAKQKLWALFFGLHAEVAAIRHNLLRGDEADVALIFGLDTKQVAPLRGILETIHRRPCTNLGFQREALDTEFEAFTRLLDEHTSSKVAGFLRPRPISQGCLKSTFYKHIGSSNLGRFLDLAAVDDEVLIELQAAYNNPAASPEQRFRVLDELGEIVATLRGYRQERLFRVLQCPTPHEALLLAKRMRPSIIECMRIQCMDDWDEEAMGDSPELCKAFNDVEDFDPHYYMKTHASRSGLLRRAVASVSLEDYDVLEKAVADAERRVKRERLAHGLVSKADD